MGRFVGALGHVEPVRKRSPCRVSLEEDGEHKDVREGQVLGCCDDPAAARQVYGIVYPVLVSNMGASRRAGQQADGLTDNVFKRLATGNVNRALGVVYLKNDNREPNAVILRIRPRDLSDRARFVDWVGPEIRRRSQSRRRWRIDE